jgi:hypothetical protein
MSPLRIITVDTLASELEGGHSLIGPVTFDHSPCQGTRFD